MVHARRLEVFQRMGVAGRFAAEGLKTLRIALFVEGKYRGGLEIADVDAAHCTALALAADEAEADERYGAHGRGLLVLIRPDRHVAVASKASVDVFNYLKMLIKWRNWAFP